MCLNERLKRGAYKLFFLVLVQLKHRSKRDTSNCAMVQPGPQVPNFTLPPPGVRYASIAEGILRMTTMVKDVKSYHGIRFYECD